MAMRWMRSFGQSSFAEPFKRRFEATRFLEHEMKYAQTGYCGAGGDGEQPLHPLVPVATSEQIELGSTIQTKNPANGGVQWLPYVLINTQGKSPANCTS